MASGSKTNIEDAGVFDLLSELCTRTASKYCTNNRISQKQLSSKMRSRSYELILHRTTKPLPCSTGDPILDLLTYHFASQQNVKNIAEFKRSLELKRIISSIRQTDFGQNKENVYNTLKFLNELRYSVKEDVSSEMYQRPFSFGVFDKMLPKMPREAFGSPQPYAYFPSHVFELPFALRNEAPLDPQRSQTYTEYTDESFDSKSSMPDNKYSQVSEKWEVKTFTSPMSLRSLTSSHMSPYSEVSVLNYPRLTAPRDLVIPGTKSHSPKVKISLASTRQLADIQEVFRADTIDIWGLATQVDKDVPDDIWEVVSKMSPIVERQLIATSSREVMLWRRMHENYLSDFNVISEKQFIRHIMYLIIGVETNSFPYSQESNCFYMKEKLVLEGISQEHLKGYVSGLCLVGTYYKRLYDFSFNHSLEDHFHSNGLIYEATREVIRRYLLEFRLKATKIFDDCFSSRSEGLNCMPTLLRILFHIEPLKYELEGMASIFKITGFDSRSRLPYGAELMSYLFNEISLVTHRQTALTAFNSLFSVCQVYFKFIEKFIFDGELLDRYHEFFIRKDSQYVHCRSKRYWDKGFHIAQGVAVPDFLMSLVKFILLCGKSLRLLKMCNPNDPLVQLITSDHPTVKCCSSFEALERQQHLLDVYRTRCLFVSGELVTFDQILLKKEAERKAFTEMAAVKQAETLEKIVAERKRLAQLIVAEKQHSLRILEAAMAEAKAAKLKSKQREKKRFELEVMGDKAIDDVDSKLRDDEKNKIMEYYSKLNMEVEKKQIHTEWKIRRLQLDQSRMQLYSTEERNLKREKLELEHKRSEVMAMSIESQPKDESDRDEIADDISEPKEIITESVNDNIKEVNEEKPKQTELERNTKKGQSSSDVFSAICNAAKNIFRSMTHEDTDCDNKKILDSQGNEIEQNLKKDTKTSSDVIGSNINAVHDNEQYQIIQHQAYLNKHKVMAHEYGTDNIHTDTPVVNKDTIDEENNVLTASDEAKRNKMKVLGTEYYLEPKIVLKAKPNTDAKKEAVINRLKILGVEYNVPTDFIYDKEPQNVAQEEAVRNRKKVLESEFETRPKESMFYPKRDNTKRSGLTLNLKPMETYDVLTPNASVTPGDMFPRLDLETPTTADVALDGALTSEMFSPRSDCSKDIESEKKCDKGYLTSEGFNFMVDVTETASVMAESSPENSPLKTVEIVELKEFKAKNSLFNILDGSYSLDEFDPFGLKEISPFNSFCLSNKMDSDMLNSCYTHPAVIMEKVKQKPCSNIHAAHFPLEDEEEQKVSCDNIATLTACLQRSVLLPLTYQLEVVNNSILTYFLVNLDMYEHLRSLKDYFFLMDGEFSRSICHNLFAKLTKTLSPQELLNFSTLHSILDKALGSSISHIHKFSENLSFSMTDTPLSFQHSSPDVLQCLSLTYSVSWPLNIILSNEAIQRYAKVFQFLIKMRRVFWVLGEDFQNLKLAVKLSKEHSRKLLRSPQYISIQIYRHVMASMIRALDNYIVTTCILTSWTEFENDLKKARTLDDLYECHVVYIKKVIFRCLLNNRSTPVMKLLNDIFTVVLKFSRVLVAGEWQQTETNGVFTHTSFGQLKELFHLFEKLAKYLHKVVTKLMECGYQRHLVELLTMVNLNGYYDPERTKDELNTSVQ